ncbi:LOW QUALITY PROTEIN: uncharacterized protein LOC129228502 [Uloborus diversus]|uniref:LOW QUALITY PROTEIN: uncharacterized protein LOC129228502 n=1 Tax=Uloborus diversus TaxID=327109 RepID=UPI00240A8A78|nr:LOW QUALITY PROTEIN: uncharacterized protein LOC129228502 [Uloborus diversus]
MHGNSFTPRSYTENSSEENKFIDLADNFHRQFKFLYPDRIRPPLYLENENGIKKLICTSLCPHNVIMPNEIREWEYCANFFSDYLDYVVLNPVVDYPKILPSLDYLLRKKKANSLETSMLLCTFLLSSGYDAYVVQGYARRHICEKLQNDMPSPDFKFKGKMLSATETDSSPPEEESKMSKYCINFEKERKLWLEGKQTVEFQKEIKVEAEDKQEIPDELFGKRVHFWVLICNCKNNEKFFIETSTGEKKLPDDSDYLGIEFAWNDRNFWYHKKISLENCQDISYDFDDELHWEAFLPNFSLENLSSGNNLHLRMPQTWLYDIEITEEQVENRYPSGGKVTKYKTAKLEKYNSRELKDGLVYKVTHYATETSEGPKISYSFYEGRKDCLEYRMVNYDKGKVKEKFSKGRNDALREHIYHMEKLPSFEESLKFYHYLRPDNLFKREWTNMWSKEYFKERTDCVVAREVSYIADDEFRGHKNIPEAEEILKKSYFPYSEQDAKSVVSEQIRHDLESNLDPSNKKSSYEVLKTSSCEPSFLKGEFSEKEVSNVEKKVSSSGISTESVSTVSEIPSETGVTSSSFDTTEELFSNTNFSEWKFKDFLNSLDEAERYATSESEPESDDDVVSKEINTKEDKGDQGGKKTNDIEKNKTGECINTTDKTEGLTTSIKTEGVKNAESSRDGATTCSEKEIDAMERKNAFNTEENEQNDISTVENSDIKTEVTDKTSSVTKTRSNSEKMVGIDKTEQSQEERIKQKNENIESYAAGHEKMLTPKNVMQNGSKNIKSKAQVNDRYETETQANRSSEMNKSNNADAFEENAQNEGKAPKNILNAKTDQDAPQVKGQNVVTDVAETEVELIDTINFEKLSDEELEIDYELFLTQIWEKYSDTRNKELFFMTHEYQKHKDMQSKRSLQTKKKVIRKRRKYDRFVQRTEKGKPDVRVFQQKTQAADEHDICSNSLFADLDLIRKINLKNVQDASKFYDLKDFEELTTKSKAENISKESMKLLDNNLNNIQHCDYTSRRLGCIKYFYSEDAATQNSIESIWFLFGTGNYRINFHYPKNHSSRKILFFSKPDQVGTEFHFSDSLCRQLLPREIAKSVGKPQLYSYLLSLIRKEVVVLRDHEKFENEMVNILATRKKEEKDINMTT